MPNTNQYHHSQSAYRLLWTYQRIIIKNCFLPPGSQNLLLLYNTMDSSSSWLSSPCPFLNILPAGFSWLKIRSWVILLPHTLGGGIHFSAGFRLIFGGNIFLPFWSLAVQVYFIYIKCSRSYAPTWGDSRTLLYGTFGMNFSLSPVVVDDLRLPIVAIVKFETRGNLVYSIVRLKMQHITQQSS